MSFTCELLSGDYAEKLDKFFGLKNALMKYNPGNCLLPPKFGQIAQQIFEFEVRKDDVWLVSYPRTGSTWCQEMIWLIGNNLDFEGARKSIQHHRAPILEISSILVTEEYDKFMKENSKAIDPLKSSMQYPRFLKSHLPMDLLPHQLNVVKPKVVYIARNAKDTCVSYYHYCQLVHNLDCTFEQFCDLFLNDMAPVGPLWNHYLPFWKKRNDPNIMFLKYEDMKKDLKEVIRKTSEFLEKPLNKQEVEELYEHLQFGNMKNNRAVNAQPILEVSFGEDYAKDSKNCFIRNGTVGDWENYMTDEMARRFDDWTTKNTQGSGLYF